MLGSVESCLHLDEDRKERGGAPMSLRQLGEGGESKMSFRRRQGCGISMVRGEGEEKRERAVSVFQPGRSSLFFAPRGGGGGREEGIRFLLHLEGSTRGGGDHLPSKTGSMLSWS